MRQVTRTPLIPPTTSQGSKCPLATASSKADRPPTVPFNQFTLSAQQAERGGNETQ